MRRIWRIYPIKIFCDYKDVKRKVTVCIVLWVLMILVWSFNGETLPFSELSFKDFIAIFLGYFVIGPIIFCLLRKLWIWWINSGANIMNYIGG